MNNICKFTILIITRNRNFIIKDCLDALEPELRHDKHEVIIVDSSEINDTERIVKDYKWVKYFRIKLPLGTRTQSYSYGARLSSGEVVVLLDDDSIVHPGWLSEIEKCYECENVGAAGGRVLPKDTSALKMPEGPMDIAVLTNEGRIVSNLYVDTGRNVKVDTLRGCNMSIKRSILEKVNYFDNRFRGQNCRVEDDVCLWVLRMGYEVIFNPKAVVCHLAEERPDIPRSELNLRSEFYVWRNTVWLYVKHFGFSLPLVFRVGLITPSRMGFRRVLGGSFRHPRLSRESLSYLPAATAAVVGGMWGVFVSVFYLFSKGLPERSIAPLLKFVDGRAQAQKGVKVHG